MRARMAFVSGPFRHDNPAQMAAHVLTAQAAGLALAKRGWCPYVPHAAIGFAYGQIDETTADAINDAFLTCADAIVLLPGWGQSVGARRELDLARKWGLMVYRSVSEVPECPSST